MDTRFKLSSWQLLVFTMLLRQCYMEINTSPTVQTNLGVITGGSKTVNIKGEEYKVSRYLGIPYAKPPVGELRFVKPQPVDAFDSPYVAKHYRASCLQVDNPMLPAVPGERSEDCLFLNVFVPDAAPDMDSGHAVMIFIHGGGFSIGSGNLYTSDTLAAFGNVIVVTVNYRLGFWGFLSTNDEHAPGNYGLWDQQAAFRWVNENIGSFGGDKDRVTIFGESAGSISVSMHALFPSNKGLFQRVITESGSAMMGLSYSPDPLMPTKTVAEQLGCSVASSEETVLCLKQQDSDIILSALNELSKDPEKVWQVSFLPTQDKDFIKFLPNELRANEMSVEDSIHFLRSIDLMNGLNSDEGALALLGFAGTNDYEEFKPTREEMNIKHIPMAVYLTLGPNVPGEITDMIIAEYTDWRNPDDPELLRDQYIKLWGDFMFNVAAIDLSRLHSNSSNEVNSYVYQFRPRPTTTLLATPSWIKGANHADELGFVFGFEQDLLDLSNTMIQPQDWEYVLSYNIMTYWSNFAKTGNPNNPVPVVANWPKYNMEEQKYIALDKDMSTDSATKQFLYAKEANLWLKTIPSVMNAIRSAHAHDAASPFSKKDEDSCNASGDCGGQ